MSSMDFQHDKKLLVIDDHKLRHEMFSATSNLLKKIKKLETARNEFLAIDQKLYQDWYNLTFRTERKESDRLEQRLQTLTTFQLHLNYIAETSGVSLSEAYRLLKEEEMQYQSGDDDWKFVIENLRKHRLDYAQKKIKNDHSKKAEPPAEPLLFETDKAEEAPQPDLSRLNRKSRSLYYFCKEAPPETLHRLLCESESGFELFKEVFQIVMECADWELLARLWKNSDEAQQTKILRSMPPHLKEFLNQMIAEAGGTNTPLPPPSQPEEDLLLKTIFRKLARLLHPDKHKENSSDQFHQWSSKILQQAHAAYENQDLNRLKRLELMAHVYMGDLNCLTLDEIYESSLIFYDELEVLKRNLKSFEKHPAWRFSSRRSYNSLTAKVRKDLMKSLAPKARAVAQLEEWLSQLEASN